MLKIEKFVTPSPAQWEIVIEGMRNPMDSWDKSDSYITHLEDHLSLNTADFSFHLGENDHELMMKLAKGGSVHAKYRRMLPVIFTVDAPLYWWKEFETYRTGVAPNPTDIDINSCSTMHKIHSREFARDMFSCDQMNERSLVGLDNDISELNYARQQYLFNKDRDEEAAKHWWYQMIQRLPSSWNQKRTISANYEALSSMWFWRHNHKLYEWRALCRWIESLPYSEIMTGKEE